MQFSLIEARIILARMVQRFTFRLHKNAEVKEKFRTVGFSFDSASLFLVLEIIVFCYSLH